MHLLGGIEGDVSINIVPFIRIENVYVVTSYRKKKIKIKFVLCNSTEYKRKVKLHIRVKDDNSITVLDFSPVYLEVLPGTSIVEEVVKRWPNPVLWGFGKYGSPYLYTVEIILKSGEKILDVFRDRFGFRKIWTEGNRFYLNGRELILYGDNIGSGASFLGVWNRFYACALVRAERNANINYIRTHTFVPPESWVEEFDKSGMLLEIEFLTGDDDNFIKWEKKNIERVIDEYYNHPAIFSWSNDNESVRQVKSVDKKLLWRNKEIIEFIQKLDNTRLTDSQGNVYLGLFKEYGMDFYP